MASKSRTPRLDLAVCGGLIALAVFILMGVKDIPPPFFDPVGSAAFPKYAAYLVIAFAIAIAIRAYTSLKTEKPKEAQGFTSEPLLALSVVAIPSLYIASMQAGMLSYRIGTVIFIFLLSSILARFEKRVMISSAIIAVVFGFGGQYLFTEVFYMDLPQ
jgi:putative tricarboxylic transport membrane protein